MMMSWWLVALAMFPVQIPRPSSGEEAARAMHAASRSILEVEAAGLGRLAGDRERAGDAASAMEVRGRIPSPPDPDGPTRFVPLPDVAPQQATERRGATEARVGEIRSRSAAAFYELARRAARANPPRYALAGECLRAVLERQPDHAEARRLLGYVPYRGGWARPFAIEQFKKGLLDHPVFGWVQADWRPHLDRGELPSPPSRGKVQWLSIAEADRLRAGWDPPWQIPTEHFLIKTNVPLAEAIGFGRRLEAFHDLFMALMADVLGDSSPMARRFRDPRLAGEPPSKLHAVFYFASKDQYRDHLRPRYDPLVIERSIGFYDPPRSSKDRSPAYFFRGPGGDLPVTANLYHEVSHQLLFETAGPNQYTRNAGNFWVFEGLGTYFETVEPRPDGSIEVGGRVGRRMEEAIRSLVGLHRMIPLERFVSYDEAAFAHDDPGIYLRYQQAMALTVFLMQARDRAYREGFLDYVRDAYRGRLRASTGRKLQDRVGVDYATLEAQLLAFLRGSPHGVEEPKPAPKPRPAPSGSIRTVPRS